MSSTNSTSDFLIDLKSVDKTYESPAGPVKALRQVDLQVGRSQLVAVVGPSGSGKSTLLNIVAAIDRPTGGEVLIDGDPIHRLSENAASIWRGKHVGVVFQFFQLLPTLTSLENVMLPMDFQGTQSFADRNQRAMQLLERVGVIDQALKFPETLSGGQRQRVAIARALANNPSILVADEPTGNLDSRTSEDILGLFAELAGDGKTVLMVTHERDISHVATDTVSIVDGVLSRD